MIGVKPAVEGRAKNLSDELDAECWSMPEQVAICGAVLAAALKMIPRRERLTQINAHLAAIELLLRGE